MCFYAGLSLTIKKKCVLEINKPENNESRKNRELGTIEKYEKKKKLLFFVSFNTYYTDLMGLLENR